jgi:hypothetical protein
MQFLSLALLRIFIIVVCAFALSTAFSLYPDLFRGDYAAIEISGLRPGERIVIERTLLTFYRMSTRANANGIVVFKNVRLGPWMVIEGGSEKLRKIEIPVRERIKSIDLGQVKVIWHEP